MKKDTTTSREATFAEFCRKHDPVLIFSAGKNGSTSLHSALSGYYPGRVVRLQRLPLTYGNEKLKHLGGHKPSDFLDYLLPRYVHATSPPPPASMDAATSRLKIITPIREPIGRDVAIFYQARLSLWLGAPSIKRHPLKRYLITRLSPALKSRIRKRLAKLTPRLSGRLLNEYIYKDKHIKQLQGLSPQQLREIFLEYSSKTSCIHWFDRYVKKHLSLDVYEKPFPATQVAYYRFHQAELMVMEYSLDNATKTQRVKDFLGIDELTIGHHNVTAEKLKALADSYELFKNEVKFPKWYLDKMLSSQFFRHFYTKEDEERLRQQWAE